MPTLKLDRDSVAMSDDVESHEATLEVDADLLFAQLLRDVRALGYLAYVGRHATWLVALDEVHQRFENEAAEPFDEYAGPFVALVAEQWPEPALLVPERATLSEVFGGHAWGLRFIYRAQADPGAVLRAVKAGRPLPDRHG